MKKLLLSVFVCLVFTGFVNAQNPYPCTPNLANTAPGLYPQDSLPSGCKNVAYDEVIDFVMPLDTSLGGSPVWFCTFRLVSSSNLPSGMGIYCSGNLDPADTTGRTWLVDHHPGVINRGCVRIVGTPGNDLSADMDSLKLAIKIGLSTDDPAANNFNCTPNPFVPYTQNYKMYWKINDCGVWGVGMETLTASSLKFVVMPNPANTQAVVSMEMPVNADLNVVVCDMMGKEVRSLFNENTNKGTHTFNVNTADLTTGIYFIKATIANTKVVTQKLMVNH